MILAMIDIMKLKCTIISFEMKAKAFMVQHPVPGTCKWLKHMLKLLVCTFMLGKVVLVLRIQISKICGQKFEEITNN